MYQLRSMLHPVLRISSTDTYMSSPYINITQYISLLMKLMFLATRTRPDILTAVCGFATKCKAPTDADQKRVDRVVG